MSEITKAGKYDDLAESLCDLLMAEGVLLVVIDGIKGTGATCTGTAHSRIRIAKAISELSGALMAEAAQMLGDAHRQQKE